MNKITKKIMYGFSYNSGNTEQLIKCWKAGVRYSQLTPKVKGMLGKPVTAQCGEKKLDRRNMVLAGNDTVPFSYQCGVADVCARDARY